MLEAQQAALPPPNPASSLPDEPRPADDSIEDDQTEGSAERQSFPGQGMDDVSLFELYDLVLATTVLL